MFVNDNKVASFKAYFNQKLKQNFSERELAQLFELTFYYLKGWEKITLRINDNAALSESELLKLNNVVKRLFKNEPIQHIFNQAEFYEIPFYVNHNVLVPRQETEELVDLIIQKSANKKVLLDIGTGSGCIPVAIGYNLPTLKLYGLDVSLEALEIAGRNAKTNDVKLNLIQQDILSLDSLSSIIEEEIDVIVSNPPYITEEEKKQMAENVLAYDPHLALFVSNETPLIFYNKIAKLAYQKLGIGGELYFEINEYFGHETKELVQSFGFQKVELIQDINGKDRIVYAVR